MAGERLEWLSNAVVEARAQEQLDPLANPQAHTQRGIGRRKKEDIKGGGYFREAIQTL